MATSLTNYYKILDRLDWTYEMSDDHGVWRRGAQEMGRAEAIQNEGPEHLKLFQEFKAHKWSPWKTKEDGSPDYTQRTIPKPEMPNESV